MTILRVIWRLLTVAAVLGGIATGVVSVLVLSGEGGGQPPRTGQLPSTVHEPKTAAGTSRPGGGPNQSSHGGIKPATSPSKEFVSTGNAQPSNLSEPVANAASTGQTEPESSHETEPTYQDEAGQTGEAAPASETEPEGTSPGETTPTKPSGETTPSEPTGETTPSESAPSGSPPTSTTPVAPASETPPRESSCSAHAEASSSAEATGPDAYSSSTSSSSASC